MKFKEVREGQYFVIINSREPATLLRMGADNQILKIMFRGTGGVEARIVKIPEITPDTEIQIIRISET